MAIPGRGAAVDLFYPSFNLVTCSPEDRVNVDLLCMLSFGLRCADPLIW